MAGRRGLAGNIFCVLMSSFIYFRMQHGKQVESVPFIGHQMTLLDLKRAILEKKELKSGLDFDLRIVDAENSAKGCICV